MVGAEAATWPTQCLCRETLVALLCGSKDAMQAPPPKGQLQRQTAFSPAPTDPSHTPSLIGNASFRPTAPFPFPYNWRDVNGVCGPSLCVPVEFPWRTAQDTVSSVPCASAHWRLRGAPQHTQSSHPQPSVSLGPSLHVVEIHLVTTTALDPSVQLRAPSEYTPGNHKSEESTLAVCRPHVRFWSVKSLEVSTADH